MIVQVLLADIVYLFDQKKALLSYYLITKSQNFNFEYQVSHLGVYKSNNLVAFKNKNIST